MALRAIVADRLTLALTAAKKVDQRFAKDEAKDKGREKRHTCPEGDVAEEVKDVTAVRKFRKPEKHSLSPLMCSARLPQFAQGVNHKAYLDAF